MMCALACRFEHHVAVGQRVVDEIRDGYGFRGKVVLAVNGAPAARTYTPRDETTVVQFVWVGSNAYKKGLDIAIEGCRRALARGVALTLDVVGMTKGALTANEPWLRDRGVISREEVARLFEESDVYLATTRYEGCSMALLEAFCAGLPVIGGPAVAWMIGDAGVRLERLDPEALCSAIIVLSDAEVRRRAAAAAAAQAALFDWNASVRRYLFEIRAIVGQPPAS
jgi:glycosyltransferase involved in cell wall biosynthesis